MTRDRILSVTNPALVALLNKRYLRVMAIKSNVFTALLLFALNFSAVNVSMAQNDSSFNVAEFNQIIDSINQANIPENKKHQLLRDMQTTMIENVRLANLPEDTKRVLIRDLESVTVQ